MIKYNISDKRSLNPKVIKKFIGWKRASKTRFNFLTDLKNGWSIFFVQKICWPKKMDQSKLVTNIYWSLKWNEWKRQNQNI